MSGPRQFVFPWPDEPQSVPSSPGRGTQHDQDAQPPHLLSTLDPCDTGGGMELPWKVFCKDDDSSGVALQLLQDSWHLFKHLRLDDWLQQAMGKQPAVITVFNMYHNQLSYSLFNFLRQYPREVKKYDTIAKVRINPAVIPQRQQV